jgi:hypothetical protein
MESDAAACQRDIRTAHAHAHDAVPGRRMYHLLTHGAVRRWHSRLYEASFVRRALSTVKAFGL